MGGPKDGTPLDRVTATLQHHKTADSHIKNRKFELELVLLLMLGDSLCRAWFVFLTERE